MRRIVIFCNVISTVRYFTVLIVRMVSYGTVYGTVYTLLYTMLHIVAVYGTVCYDSLRYIVVTTRHSILNSTVWRRIL